MTRSHLEATVTNRQTRQTRPTSLDRPGFLGTFGRTAVMAGVLLAAGLAVVLVGAPPAARAQARGEKEQERAKWEARIVFFGEEDTGLWSLRIPDKSATERARIKFTELWKYDPEGKKW